MTCPHCRADARCKGFRRRAALTPLGDVRFGRHYYHCRRCGRGVSPPDASLGLSAADPTPAAGEVACPAGAQDSFVVAAAEVLARLSGRQRPPPGTGGQGCSIRHRRRGSTWLGRGLHAGRACRLRRAGAGASL
jgi:hypothetical protein